MPTKNLLELKNIYFWLALLWTSLIAFLCLESANELPNIKINNIDKLVHANFHLVFTLLWFLFFRNKNRQNTVKKSITKAFLMSFLYGISIEIAQQLFTTTRKADIFDVLANTAGALVTVTLVFVIPKFIKNENL